MAPAFAAAAVDNVSPAAGHVSISTASLPVVIIPTSGASVCVAVMKADVVGWISSLPPVVGACVNAGAAAVAVVPAAIVAAELGGACETNAATRTAVTAVDVLVSTAAGAVSAAGGSDGAPASPACRAWDHGATERP